MKKPQDKSLLDNPFSSTITPRLVTLQKVEIGNLLQLMVEGEQNRAENLISKNPELLSMLGSVTDLSGRIFRKITAFQYALWALDFHMVKMILKHLQPEIALQQLRELEDKGTEHGKQFNLNLYVDALGEYISKYSSWTWSERENHWAKVGELQRLLPVHVVNEYCRSDRPFDPCPSFVEATLPRTRRIISEYKDEKKGEIRLSERGEWYTYPFRDNKLSGFFRNSHGGATTTHRQLSVSPGVEALLALILFFPMIFALGYANIDAPYDHDVRPDFIALQKLSKVRTAQFNALKSHLQSKISLQTPSVLSSINTSISSVSKITDNKPPKQQQLSPISKVSPAFDLFFDERKTNIYVGIAEVQLRVVENLIDSVYPATDQAHAAKRAYYLRYLLPYQCRRDTLGKEDVNILEELEKNIKTEVRAAYSRLHRPKNTFTKSEIDNFHL